MTTLQMDVYLLYAYVGFVCAAVIAIINNRLRSTEYKEIIDRKLCNVLKFFITFCIVDASWGLIGSPYLIVNGHLFTIASYFFHIMAAWASFVCSYYVLQQMDLKKNVRKAFNITRYILIVIQMVLIFQNIFTHNFFTIDADALYHSGAFRLVAFILQFLHYVPIIIYSLYNMIIKSKNEYRYRSTLIFSAIPWIFGILQMLYPDGSFYSLGFLVTSVAMYSFGITEQRESYVAQAYVNIEREKSSAKIREALKKAEEASKSKSIFLANMSHDIRTPINGIMGMVTIAQKEEMPEKVEECIGKISTASRHLLSLVNDVLDMSRIESGATKIDCTPADIRTVVDNCSSIIKGMLENRELELVTNCESVTNSHVFVDVIHLRQILINILGNAVKFTPDGGSITFAVREISADDEFASFEFKVKDTGIGMTPEFLEHIYDAFSQENSGSRSNYKGTGLGMAITKQLVELMNGTIEVESEVEKGSTFTIVIPFKIDTTDYSASKNEKSDEAIDNFILKGARILLVEDNELNMEIAHTLLEDEGAIVTEAADGKIAYDAFKDNPPNTFDVILMDLMMPNMNGFEATKAIRSYDREDATEIPIIAMTANAFEEDKQKTKEAGMNAHVSKPIEFSLLVKTLSKYLKHK